jgi:hypothetical protein
MIETPHAGSGARSGAFPGGIYASLGRSESMKFSVFSFQLSDVLSRSAIENWKLQTIFREVVHVAERRSEKNGNRQD